MNRGVRTVDDTARWVAHHRAIESARPDALFHDLLAARLAGSTGVASPESGLGRTGIRGRRWLVPHQPDGAAGPRGGRRRRGRLRACGESSVQVSTPGPIGWISPLTWSGSRWTCRMIVSEKNALLATESPRCRLRRVPLDLTDSDALTAVLTPPANPRPDEPRSRIRLPIAEVPRTHIGTVEPWCSRRG